MFIKHFDFRDHLNNSPEGKLWGAIVENIYAFGNAGGLQFGVVDPVVRASAIAMIAPVARITTVSGAAAMTTIAIPWPGFTGTIAYIPSGIFTGATGGTADGTNMPIGLAFTSVIGKVLFMTFDGAKWWPSYTA